MRTIFPVMISFTLLLACAGPEEQPPVPSAANETPAPAPTLDQLASATYSGILQEPFALVNGVWEGEPYTPEGAARPSVVLVDSVAPSGDLDDDGAAETIAVLAASGGGTGSNTHLAVVKNAGGEMENVATALVGDRVQLISLTVNGALVSGVFVQAGDGDAMCCPSAKVRRSWKLEGSQLVELPAEDLGKVSIADLAGTWTLNELPRGTHLPEGVEVTLKFDGTTASGTSGCNSYSGTIAEKSPRELEPGLFMGTQKFCEGPSMDVEHAYMKALGSAQQYSFLGTRLAISYTTDDGGTETMLFVRAE